MKRLVTFGIVPLLVLALFLAPVLLVLPALAASASSVAVPSAAAVGSGVLLWANSTAGIVGMAIALWLFQQWLRTYVQAKGLENDARVRDYVMPVLDLVVNAAFARLGPIGLLASVGPTASPEAIAMRREVERDAVRYVEERVPGGLAHLGQKTASVQEMASVRLDALAADLMKRGAVPVPPRTVPDLGAG